MSGLIQELETQCLRFYFFVSDVIQGNEGFRLKRVDSRFSCEAPGMERFSASC